MRYSDWEQQQMDIKSGEEQDRRMTPKPSGWTKANCPQLRNNREGRCGLTTCECDREAASLSRRLRYIAKHVTAMTTEVKLACAQAAKEIGGPIEVEDWEACPDENPNNFQRR